MGEPLALALGELVAPVGCATGPRRAMVGEPLALALGELVAPLGAPLAPVKTRRAMGPTWWGSPWP